jgi:hypothetical protein
MQGLKPFSRHNAIMLLTNRRRFLCTCGAAIAGWLTHPGLAQAAPWAADCEAAAKPLPTAAQALL